MTRAGKPRSRWPSQRRSTPSACCNRRSCLALCNAPMRAWTSSTPGTARSILRLRGRPTISYGQIHTPPRTGSSSGLMNRIVTGLDLFAVTTSRRRSAITSLGGILCLVRDRLLFMSLSYAFHQWKQRFSRVCAVPWEAAKQSRWRAGIMEVQYVSQVEPPFFAARLQREYSLSPPPPPPPGTMGPGAGRGLGLGRGKGKGRCPIGPIGYQPPLGSDPEPGSPVGVPGTVRAPPSLVLGSEWSPGSGARSQPRTSPARTSIQIRCRGTIEVGVINVPSGSLSPALTKPKRWAEPAVTLVSCSFTRTRVSLLRL